MEDLEQQLKNALARKDAPDWLEAKVLAAAAREPERRRSWRPRWMFAGRLRWASAVVAAAAVVSGITWQHERAVRDRAAGEDAKARLELALRITSTKLRKIEQRLNEVERAN
jgi:hypothetical protein